MLDIYPGTYDLQDYITSAEKVGSYYGLMLPDYVHMRGIGERDDIIINCALANDADAIMVERTSTLNLRANNSLENLTFTGTNVRYVVHDESSNTVQDWKRIVKKCKFVHNGNAEGFWTYTDAWGEGCSSGSYSYFEDCIFENNSKVPSFIFHTNTNFDSACTHIFKNCRFVQNYDDTDTTGVFGINDIQCGQPINVEFIGCVFTRFIFVQNNNSATDIAELNITGHGNTPVYLQVYRPNVSNPKAIFLNFSDEVALVYNAGSSAIDKGRPLKYNDFRNNRIGTIQSGGVLCAGIALESIPSKSYGHMQYSGIVPFANLGLTALSVGSKVGVENYTLAAVTDGTDFAKVIASGTLMFN